MKGVGRHLTARPADTFWGLIPSPCLPGGRSAPLLPPPHAARCTCRALLFPYRPPQGAGARLRGTRAHAAPSSPATTRAETATVSRVHVQGSVRVEVALLRAVAGLWARPAGWLRLRDGARSLLSTVCHRTSSFAIPFLLSCPPGACFLLLSFVW